MPLCRKKKEKRSPWFSVLHVEHHSSAAPSIQTIGFFPVMNSIHSTRFTIMSTPQASLVGPQWLYSHCRSFAMYLIPSTSSYCSSKPLTSSCEPQQHSLCLEQRLSISLAMLLLTHLDSMICRKVFRCALQSSIQRANQSMSSSTTFRSSSCPPRPQFTNMM